MSHLLGRVSVYAHELDRRWVTRPDDVVVHWHADRAFATRYLGWLTDELRDPDDPGSA